MDALDVAQMLGGDIRDLAIADAHVRPRSKAELKSWARTYFGWQLSERRMCDKHQTPLEILWEMFNEDVLDVVILASRTGGKTLLIAMLNVLDSVFKNGCEIGSMGAVLYQAQKGYGYYSQMITNEMFNEDVVSTMMKETKLRNGSVVQILAGTMTGVNAPHPHKARADEVELIDWGILQQFFSMARSERGIMGQQVLSSTRKTLYGSMQRLLDKMEKEPSFPFVLRAWCVREILEKCEFNCVDCRDIVRPSDHRSFWDVCRGCAKDGDGFYLVRDAHRKFLTLDDDVWDSEWECRRPAKRGLVFKDMPDDRFGRYAFDPDRKTFCGADDGFVDPFSFHVYQADSGDNIFVVRELYGPGIEPSTWAERIIEVFGELGLGMSTPVFVDVRAKSLFGELRKAGFKGVRSRHHEIIDSLRHVKKWVRGARHPKLYVDSERCPNLKAEMNLYRYPEDGRSESPVDEDNHACDDMRYAICGQYPRYRTTESVDVPISGGDKSSVRGQLQDRAKLYQDYGIDPRGPGPSEPRPY